MASEIEIPCPSCKKKLVSARSAVPGTTVKCQSCGVDVSLKGDDMRKAQRALDDLKKALKNFGG